MKYTAFVPARSGSKRLRDKNIKRLAGKPLLIWTLEACIESKLIDEVILSTDSMEYYELANTYINDERLKLDLRDPNDAGDKVKIFDYLNNNKDKIFRDRTGAFILALPTIPLRQTIHIDESIALFERKSLPVFSATTYSFPTSFAFRVNDDGSWSPMSNNSPMISGNTRSQDQIETYRPNGAIYVRLISDLDNNNLQTLYTGALPYMMDAAVSVDIDNEIDFKVAETLCAK